MSNEKVSVAQAVGMVMAFIDDNRVPGRRESTSMLVDHAISTARLGPVISLTWERGWAADASLVVRFNRIGMPIEVQVGWSGGGQQDPGSARVAAVLHAQVADLALAIEHKFANLRVDFDLGYGAESSRP